MEQREFSRLLREAHLSPNEYATLTGFDRRNVKRWVFDDTAIPEQIRSIVLLTLTQFVEHMTGPIDAPIREERISLVALASKLKLITQPVMTRKGDPYITKPCRRETSILNEKRLFADLTNVASKLYDAGFRPAD
jgi:hypothetical protein